MITFQTHNDCTLCPLHQQCKRPGIPTRCLHFRPGRTTAILFVGEAPGAHEDFQGINWVGKAGQILQGFIRVSGLTEVADIYLGNAVRCRPRDNDNPTTGQCSKCRPWLQRDLDLLLQKYDRVYLMACGRWGLEAILKAGKLGVGLSNQGLKLRDAEALKPGKYKGLRGRATVFSTYHPAMLIPGRHMTDKSGRSPELTRAVQAHFELLLRHVNGEETPDEFERTPIVLHYNEVFPQRPEVEYVEMDVETYGILRGQTQTGFHPVRMAKIDEVPRGRQVVSVCFGFWKGDKYHAYFYPGDRVNRIAGALKVVSLNGIVLRGQNIKFDVAVLRYHSLRISQWLDPRKIKLDDTLLLSFLAYEGQPERGLKELSYLWGLYDYRSSLVTGKKGTASGYSDPNLIRYNALDCYNTSQLAAECWRKIKELYGPNSAKFSPLCADMRNWVLWDVIMLEEAGIALDLWTLGKLHEHLDRRVSQLEAASQPRGLVLSGKGSVKSKRELIERVFRKHNALDKMILSEKERVPSHGKENTNLGLLMEGPASEDGRLLAALKLYVETSKLRDSYTKPLLYKPNRGILRRGKRVGLVYPYWYPMPSRFGEDDEGGTKQARFSAQKPGAQTFPKRIKEAFTSRFEGGEVWWYDLSQIELRIAGVLSGDPKMLGDYREGKDRHRETALVLFPGSDPDSPSFHDRERQGGKTINFLVLFKGGAWKARETLLQDYGIEIPLEILEQGIQAFDSAHHVFRGWQEDLILRVRDFDGFLELPTGWSRYWGTGASMFGKVSEICDFPIQTTAAQLLQSAQFAMHCEFLDQGLSSVIMIQVHDSLGVDTFPGEGPIVDKLAEKYLTNPPLYGRLLEVLGQERSVPLEYRKEK